VLVKLETAERARLRELRDRLWQDYENEETCRPTEGATLTEIEWQWLKDLVSRRRLSAEIASGFTTPNPFVLLFDANDETSLFMIHPSHLLPDLLKGAEATMLFREVQDSSASR
jgi:hypothetical protein